MSKPTLLEIVQEVLNDLDADFVNSIDDTEESQQVVSIVASTYRAMLSNRNWPHALRTLNLTPSADNNLPTHMTIEEEIKELVSIFYNKIKADETRINYLPIKYKEPDDFLRFTFGRNSDAANVITINDPTGVKFLITNDQPPSYYTSFDDNTLVFDSFDSSVDNTLQASKTLARAYVTPAFIISDTAIPDLPDEAFSALIEEAKSKAAYKLKQQTDEKSEQEAGRQQRWLARKDWRVKGGIRYPNYGRRRNVYKNPDPTFRGDN